MSRTVAERLLEGALWSIAALCGGYACFCFYEAKSTHFVPAVQAKQQSAADTDGPIVGKVEGGSYSLRPALADGQVIGNLAIPDLKLSVPIVEGVSKNDLLRGIGHVPRSATAGGLGNIALAAHRDTYFRPLRYVKPGMAVLIASDEGTYKYQVDNTEIVLPEQVSVLEIGTVPQLTFITCYPFDYIGAAPKRFIVHAHLTSLIPVGRPHTGADE